MTFPEISLPNRPLALKQSSLSMPRGYAFSIPIVLLLTVFIFHWQGPNLWRDYQISQNPMVMENGRILDGECKTRKGFFTNCEARLSYTHEGKSYESETHIFFVDAHSGDYETDIVISADHPDMATLSLGLEKLWNRFIAFGVLFGLMAALCLMAVFVGFRIAWARSRLTTPATLKPVPVEISAFTERFGRMFVTYVDKIADDKTKRTAYSLFGKGQEPIIIGEADGKAIALAVRHGKTAYPILLDPGLERIRMTDEERAVALASIAAATANEAVAELPPLREPVKKGGFLRSVFTFVAVIALIVAAALGYWLWYVTSAKTQYVQIGMEINNMLPAAMNEWGCDQLQKRFGDQNAPFGCTASDYTSWK